MSEHKAINVFDSHLRGGQECFNGHLDQSIYDTWTGSGGCISGEHISRERITDLLDRQADKRYSELKEEVNSLQNFPFNAISGGKENITADDIAKYIKKAESAPSGQSFMELQAAKYIADNFNKFAHYGDNGNVLAKADLAYQYGKIEYDYLSESLFWQSRHGYR